jgi:hypothetical protein
LQRDKQALQEHHYGNRVVHLGSLADYTYLLGLLDLLRSPLPSADRIRLIRIGFDSELSHLLLPGTVHTITVAANTHSLVHTVLAAMSYVHPRITRSAAIATLNRTNR